MSMSNIVEKRVLRSELNQEFTMEYTITCSGVRGDKNVIGEILYNPELRGCYLRVMRFNKVTFNYKGNEGMSSYDWCVSYVNKVFKFVVNMWLTYSGAFRPALKVFLELCFSDRTFDMFRRECLISYFQKYGDRANNPEEEARMRVFTYSDDSNVSEDSDESYDSEDLNYM